LLLEAGDRFDFVILTRDGGRAALKVGGRDYACRGTDFSVDSLADILKGCEAVVHLAAARPRAGDEAEDWPAYLSNVAISAALWEGCRRAGVSNVVNLSSISAYGAGNRLPFSEDQKPLPDGCYGWSKAAVESLADYYNRKFGMRIKSLRVAQVVGLGEREKFMLMTFIKRAAVGEPLTVYGEGAGRREYVYIRDVASAIAAALDKFDLRGIYNIGTGVSTSHRELAELVNQVFDNRGNLRFAPDVPEDKSHRLMDIRRAEREMEWKAEWALRGALEDIRRTMNCVRNEVTKQTPG
jgi:UDP-glucose 4-epimerase